MPEFRGGTLGHSADHLLSCWPGLGLLSSALAVACPWRLRRHRVPGQAVRLCGPSGDGTRRTCAMTERRAAACCRPIPSLPPPGPARPSLPPARIGRPIPKSSSKQTSPRRRRRRTARRQAELPTRTTPMPVSRTLLDKVFGKTEEGRDPDASVDVSRARSVRQDARGQGA